MNTDLATMNPNDQFLAAFGLDDSIPRASMLKLVHPGQGGDGKFVDTKTGFRFAKMTLVPLKISAGRTLMPPKEEGFDGVRPICKSLDRIMPVISDDLIRQDNGLGCARCLKAVWKSINGKKIPPECRDNFDFTFIHRETGLVYWYPCKGSAIGPIKELKEAYKNTLTVFNRNNPNQTPFWGFEVEMSSVLGTRGGTRYYVPVFSMVRPILHEALTQEEFAQARSFYDEATAAFKSVADRGVVLSEADEDSQGVDSKLNDVTEGQYADA